VSRARLSSLGALSASRAEILWHVCGTPDHFREPQGEIPAGQAANERHFARYLLKKVSQVRILPGARTSRCGSACCSTSGLGGRT
jgi:hypothetical protein